MRFYVITLADNGTQKVREQGGKYVVAPRVKGGSLYRHTHLSIGARGGIVVKALRYKLAGRGFDSRWCHWNFSVT